MAKSVQFTPVIGTHDGSPLGRRVTVKIAVGGLFVIVSVIGPPGLSPGRAAPVMSTNLTSVILKEEADAGLLTSSKGTLARRLPLMVAETAGNMLTAVCGATSEKKTLIFW